MVQVQLQIPAERAECFQHVGFAEVFFTDFTRIDHIVILIVYSIARILYLKKDKSKKRRAQKFCVCVWEGGVVSIPILDKFFIIF